MARLTAKQTAELNAALGPEQKKPKGVRKAALKDAAKPKPVATPKGSKRNEQVEPAPEGTPAEQVDATIAKIDAALAASKARLSPKAETKAGKPAGEMPQPQPKPAKAKPAPKQKRAGTYSDMQTNRFTASKIESPVRAMWDLCGEMVGSKRKDVIAAAVAKGISFYTARTQYQLWLTAYRNSTTPTK